MDCHSRRTLSIRELEEIHAIEESTSEEEVEDEDQTFITLDVGELLVIQRVFHVQEAHCDPNQREQLFHTRCTIKGKVCELIIDGENYTNAASTTLTDKLRLPTMVLPTPNSL